MNIFKHKQVTITSIATYAILTGAMGLFYSKLQAADAPRASPKPALTVTTVAPQQGSLAIKLTANGNIAAWQEAIVGSEASGLRLLTVRANVGDVVRAGQVLASFAPESVQADLAQARAGLAEAQANASDASGNAERARTLQTTGALSTQQISQYLTSEQTAKARVDAARAMLAVQQQRLKHTQVLAPDSGIISARSATVGAVLQSGTELFRMIRQGRLEWRAEVTSAELGRIAIGTAATVTAASGAQVKGRVRMVAPTVDPVTRSALVYVDLPASPGGTSPKQSSDGPPPGSGTAAEPKLAPSGLSAAAPILPSQDGTARRAVASGIGLSSAVRAATSVGAFLPGMFAKGEFELGNLNALTVPQTALIIRDGFSYVYRVGADNRVAQVKVQTGRMAGDRVEITGGLAADARLVASGAGFLNDGDLVRVVEAKK